MGSRYDIVLLHGTTLDTVRAAIAERSTVGARVDGPWAGESGATIAELASTAGTSVVVAAAPMRTPRGFDARLARVLGVEMLAATVWDSVGSFSLDVLGPGVDRSRSVDAEDDASSERGAPLPEEPLGSPLDEAYVQHLCLRRYGIDPGAIDAIDATWHALVPVDRGMRRA